jgi:gamma-glutamylcysteine synthetase
MYRQQYIETALNTQVITDEFRQKVSNSTKGIKKTITQKVLDKNERLKVELSGIGNPMYGKKQTDNAKLLISKRLTKHYENPENRKKQALTRIGSKHSEEVKNKMSKDRAGAGNAMFGKKHSEETRKKISEAGKKRYKTERQDNINRI